MVRKALRPARRQQVSVGQSIPAPVGGWDGKNALAAMPVQNAVILDNFIPRPGYVELRRGFVPQVTGTPGPVESMIAYRAGAGTDKLFAACAGKLFDVSVQGAAPGAPVLSGLTNNRWNYTSFANPAGAWSIAANGADTPIGYNAGAWAALALTGASGPIDLVPTTLFNVFGHAGRLYFLQQNSLFIWSPAAGAVQGACTLLDLSSVFSKGGRLVCGGTWSWQYGLQADEFAIFMTDQGQVAIYQGTDPTNADNWSLLGVYDLGPPLGPKALVKYGGDLVIVTSDGVVPLSQSLTLDRSELAKVALTQNILNPFSAAVKAYRGNYGWQGILYAGTSSSTDTDAAGGSLAIFNIPTATLQTSMQFVQNVLTGAWCRFPTGINSFCWEIANQNIYFGAANGVYQWDQGSSDNGVPIVGDVKTAFSNLGYAGTKEFTMIRPVMKTTPLVMPALDIDVDYQDSEPTAVPTVVDQDSTTSEIRFDWTGVGSAGWVGAARMQVNLIGSAISNVVGADTGGDTLAIDNTGTEVGVDSGLPFDVPVQLLSFDIVYQRGGIL